jgi:hypothetical protein
MASQKAPSFMAGFFVFQWQVASTSGKKRRVVLSVGFAAALMLAT